MRRLQKLLDTTPRRLYSMLRHKFNQQPQSTGLNYPYPCVFVLSTGRVGTQTLAALLGCASNVMVYHEPSPKLFGLSKLAYLHGQDAAAHQILLEAWQIARSEKLRYALSCGKGYIETSPQVTFLAPVIHEIVPHAKFIHMARDPRDVIRSGMRRKWYAGQVTDPTRITPRAGSPYVKEWNILSTFKKNLWLWAETNRWILDYCTTLSPEKSLLIRAEDLFDQNPDVIASLFRFIDTEPPATRIVQRILGQLLNAQKRGSFPKSEQWSEEWHQEISEIAGDIAPQLGYSLR